MDGDIGFGYTHRQKRTHADMQDEGSSSPTWPSLHRLSASRERNDGSPSRPNVSGLHLPQITTMAPSQQPRRYPGDGLDLRRPVSSLSRNNSDTAVIDLTADDSGPSASNNRPSISAHPAPPRPPNRLPRFAREIIDIDEEDTPRSAPDSPEIEFISSRRIDPPRESPVRRNIDEDDLEILGSNIVPGHRMWGVGAMMAMADVLRDEPERPIAHLQRHIQRAANNMRRPVPPPRGGRGSVRGHGHIHIGFIAPDMNFEMVGFDLGMGGGGGPAPPPPTYDPPEAAPDGFTRSPNENDPLVCPNCEEELCVGETEQKRQVWIVKGCGHVYCGECTANRSIKRSAKGKERIPPIKHKPFKECVVDSCNKKLSNPKSMIQVFL